MTGLWRRLRGAEPEPRREQTDDADLERFFTDAEEARSLFERLVEADELPRRILIVHGPGAVGKSSLLKMYRLFCHRKGVAVGLVASEDAPSAVDLLERWSSDLRADGVEMASFDRRLGEYRAVQARAETEAAKLRTLETDAAGQLTKAASRGLAAAAGAIPIAGSVVAAVGPEAIEAVLNAIRAKLSKEEYDLYTDPTGRLTGDFLVDVERAAARRRHVLMLDTFEQASALDDWLRVLVAGLPDGVLTVIAGRQLPDWDREWPGWVARAEVIALTEWTTEHMEQLVRQYYSVFGRGEPDDELVRDVVEFARGLPMIATTAVRLRITHGFSDLERADAGVAAELADRLLEGVPAEQRPAFEAAAVLRSFNADSLEALLDQGDASTLYDELRRWPFTRSLREGLAVHETLREVINAALSERSPERFRQLHERAAAHYERQLAHAGGEQADRLRLQWLYHLFRADEAVGVDRFRALAEELVRAQWLARLRALLGDVAGYRLQLESSRLWRRYYEARLEQLVGHTATAEAEYRPIGRSDDAEPTLRAYALCDLGAILAALDRLAEADGEQRALAAVRKSLELQPALDSKLVTNHITLMNVSNARADWDDSIEHVGAARAFAEANGDTYALVTADHLQAELYGLLGDWPGYLGARGRCLDTLSGLGDAPALEMRVKYFTWPLAFMGRPAEAQASSEEALALAVRLEERELMVTIRESIGLALGLQERWEAAAEQFAEAYSFHEDFHRREAEAAGSPDRYVRALLSFRGLVALRAGRLDEAAADLQRALDVKQEIGDRIGTPELHVWRAQLYELRGAPADAAPEYGRALGSAGLGRRHFHCAALVGLARVGAPERRATLLAEGAEPAGRFGYDDQLAALQLLRARLEWEGGGGFNGGLAYCREALSAALRYNRFLLDEALAGRPQGTVLQPVVALCREHGDEGRRLLEALRAWWAGNQELLEAERAARARERGDGSAQRTVIDQLDAALAG